MSDSKRTFSVKGSLVDPIKREIRGVEIFVSEGKIVDIKNCPDVKQPFILPGFVDAHVHIESSMLIPSQFAKMAVKHGTVAVVTDPHEVANVAGVDGIKFMQKNAKEVPMKFFFGVPSCVPASPLEKSGSIIDAEMVSTLIQEEDFFFLAEMMNFPGVIYDDTDVHKKITAALAANKPVDGHVPGLSGEPLKKYVKAGITTDHECSTMDEAKEKIGLGMKILIREGSAAKNYSNLIPLIKEHKNSIMFCTDDCHPDYLEKGHINKIVSRAVNDGYDLFDTLLAACINPVIHYSLSNGTLQVGHPADFVVVNDLKAFDVLETYIDGNKVFANNEVHFSNTKSTEPNFTFRDHLDKNSLKVFASGKKMNIIGVLEGELLTKWLVEDTPVLLGDEIQSNVQEDLLKIVLIDRYTNDKPIVAFIRGFGLKKGAIAASIAHDSHHILSIGCDDKSIDSALGWVVENRGGLCFALQDNVDGIPLPYYGLMTDMDGTEVSKRYKGLNMIVKESGCVLASPFMTASFMALTVIPELKIYHRGLFDGIAFKHVDLFS